MIVDWPILGDTGADNGGERKSKRAGKYGTKKSKERREEPLGTRSYQTSSKRSPPFWLLIWQKNTKVLWHQSEARTVVTVWNWSCKTLSPGALLAVGVIGGNNLISFSLFHLNARSLVKNQDAFAHLLMKPIESLLNSLNRFLLGRSAK